MPQQQEKRRQWLGNPTAPAKIGVDPSAKFFSKRSPISEETQTEWPELAKAWASREINMPYETSRASSVGPMNWLERFLFKDALATASPFGGISLNRPFIESIQGGVDLNDILTHELTHVTQPFDISRLWKGLSIPYYKRPEEVEAEQARMNRKKPKDILLEVGPSQKQVRKMVK